MLDNTVTMAVDHDHDGTPTDEVFSRYDEFNNRTIYIGADHSLETRNLMTVTRNFPTVSGNFKGVAKSSVKFTQDIEVNGVDSTTTIVAPDIASINFSLPVGFTAAEALHLRERMIAALNNQDFITRLTESLEI